MTWLFQGSGTQSRKHSARKMENLCKRVANNVGNERWKLCNALHLKNCIHGVRMDSLNWHLTTILLGKPDWRNNLHTKGRDNAWCRKNGADNLWQNDWNLDKPTGNNLKTNGHENFKGKKHIDEDDQKSKRARFSGFITGRMFTVITGKDSRFSTLPYGYSLLAGLHSSLQGGSHDASLQASRFITGRLSVFITGRLGGNMTQCWKCGTELSRQRGFERAAPQR